MSFTNAFITIILSDLGYSAAGIGGISAAALICSAIAILLAKDKVRILKPYNIRAFGLFLVLISYFMGIWPSKAIYAFVTLLSITGYALILIAILPDVIAGTEKVIY